MPVFTKDQVLQELKVILRAEAVRLEIVRSHEIARAFLGLPEDVGDLSSITLDRIDLEKFHVASTLAWLYGYAFAPTAAYLADDVHFHVTNGLAFIDSVMDDGALRLEISHGEVTGACRDTVDAGFARWKLDFEDGETLTIRELALLANMTEGSVRNAARAAGESRLTTYNEGARALVTAEEARRWLAGRRGFAASPLFRVGELPPSGAFHHVKTRAEFGKLLSMTREASKRTVDQLASVLGWTPSALATWEAGEWRFALGEITALAAELHLEPWIVAPKALELDLLDQPS